jgi:hypothetical protein
MKIVTDESLGDMVKILIVLLVEMWLRVDWLKVTDVSDESIASTFGISVIFVSE